MVLRVGKMKKCVECGEGFSETRTTQIYCCFECRKVGYKKNGYISEYKKNEWKKIKSGEKEYIKYKQEKALKRRQARRISRGLDIDHVYINKNTPHKDKRGYIRVYCPKHANVHKNGFCLQHTMIMSEYLGRPLRKGENVHHINGVRDDNRIENLELWTISQPPGQRVEDKIKWATEFLQSYGYEINRIENDRMSSYCRRKDLSNLLF